MLQHLHLDEGMEGTYQAILERGPTATGLSLPLPPLLARKRAPGNLLSVARVKHGI